MGNFEGRDRHKEEQRQRRQDEKKAYADKQRARYGSAKAKRGLKAKAGMLLHRAKAVGRDLQEKYREQREGVSELPFERWTRDLEAVYNRARKRRNNKAYRTGKFDNKDEDALLAAIAALFAHLFGHVTQRRFQVTLATTTQQQQSGASSSSGGEYSRQHPYSAPGPRPSSPTGSASSATVEGATRTRALCAALLLHLLPWRTRLEPAHAAALLLGPAAIISC